MEDADKRALEESVAMLLTQGVAVTFLPELGPTVMRIKFNARRFIMRRKADHTELTVPPGATASQIIAAIESMLPKMAAKPHDVLRYHDGQQIVLDGVTINIRTHNPRIMGERLMASVVLPNAYVSLPEGTDFDNEYVTADISNILRRVARRVAATLLLPLAKSIADRVGAHPISWEISSGYRILGHCNHRGVIALSEALVFLPEELREYVICHELAHLSEMNHSPRFHLICNAYCAGREPDLRTRLKAFRWPILR